tara:strand:+ start:7130 stop:7591 length:462 start_codon:yes stop_codon:yes gene_type:complete
MPVTIKMNDEREIETELQMLKKLQTIQELINMEEGEEDELDECNIEIPLDIEYDIMDKILQVCKYEYENKEKNITEDDRFNWYNNYFTCNNDILNKILESADYLGYEELVDMGCEKIANDIKSCKSVDDVKKKFGVSKEITKEQENELLNMYK